MKIRGRLKGHKLTVMVDSGASHNIIANNLVTQLGLLVQSTPTFGLKLGDGHGPTDHRIPLLLGIALISVRPYRYAHGQKDEIEKLVAEMLSAGIIQPSSRHLLQQPITTLAQQHWVAKLLGYDFEIKYKPGNTNKAADALSRCEEEFECQPVAIQNWVDMDQVDKERVIPKLAARYFGPFQILERVGPVAYKLLLPVEARIHPVFHVSQLKLVIGNHPVVTELPKEMVVTENMVEPEKVLNWRRIIVDQYPVIQILIQWKGKPEEEATWMNLVDIQNQFPSFNLEDKVGLSERGNDMDSKLQVGCNGPRPLRVYSRRNIKGNAKGMAIELDDHGRKNMLEAELEVVTREGMHV
ncbi:hypothetical protein GH714_000855 [Hevea brasiliensis]|uniref:Tf2-1-like SH3-like domain-containing protein n=1 Tax=Hevea brasiliensis TaxID=3981 RepID=A0A6A6KHD3_HEVBR|nr:hypothetical protein GH714_000855 [Hevea brasiliensis]